MTMTKKPSRLPFYNPIEPTSSKIFNYHTLVMPICAVGNIGQLACDLIISTLLAKGECELVGRIYSPALMSVVGPNAFNLNGPPTTSSEVYESKKHKLVIIQQRTSYYKDLKNLYISDLLDWIKESKFNRVIALTSSFAQCNPDTNQLAEPFSCPLKTITTKSFTIDQDWTSLNLKSIPDKSTLKVIQDGLTFLPGSGMTKSLLEACERASIPIAFIIDFCSEGINIQDAYEVANVVDSFLRLDCRKSCRPELKENSGSSDRDYGVKQPQSWVEPLSWTQEPC